MAEAPVVTDPPAGPSLFAICPPSLESVVAEEVRALGFGGVRPEIGGVTFVGNPVTANRALATPSRILMRLASFPAPDFAALQRGVARVDFSRFGDAGFTPDVSCHRSRLYHTGAVAERVAAQVPKGDLALYVRLDRDVCTLSVDTSGERLHRRGWRQETGPAPIRETLAAALLRLAGWRPDEPLYDPMCGSGTFLVEAACRAAGLAPGRLRTFACEGWARAGGRLIGQALAEGQEPGGCLTAEGLGPGGCLTAEGLGPGGCLTAEGQEPGGCLIRGSDRARPAVEAARRNAERAGVSVAIEVVEVGRLDAGHLPPGPPGLLITNPPYDRRAGGAEHALGRLALALQGPFARWRAAVLVPEGASLAALGRPATARYPLQNGGLRVSLALLDPRPGP